MALSVGGSTVALPTPVGDPKVVFEELGKQFNLDAKVITYLVEKVGLTTLEEFSYLVVKEDEFTELVAKIPDLESKMLQTARLRMAWTGVRDAAKTAIANRRGDQDAEDLDALLPKPQLDQLQDSFWLRYKLSFPPDDDVCDALLSRIYRELQRRLLTVRDVWATKTLAHQLRSEQERSKRPKDQREQGKDIEGPPKQTVANFLRLLMVLLLAYAKAGVARRDSAPVAEKRGADTTLYVQAPLDWVWRYYRRVAARAARLAELGVNVLDWISKRDEAERSMWVELFRISDRPLGCIIKEVYEKRESVWMIDEDAIRERQFRRNSEVKGEKAGGRAQETRYPGATVAPKSASRPSKWRKVAENIETVSAFRNGMRLCEAYNTAGCQ